MQIFLKTLSGKTITLEFQLPDPIEIGCICRTSFRTKDRDGSNTSFERQLVKIGGERWTLKSIGEDGLYTFGSVETGISFVTFLPHDYFIAER